VENINTGRKGFGKERKMASTPIFSDDLIVEILSWLPVNILMRFRCVSKTWNSLIFSSYFAKLHLERSSRNMQILLKLKDLDRVKYLGFILLYIFFNPKPSFLF